MGTVRACVYTPIPIARGQAFDGKCLLSSLSKSTPLFRFAGKSGSCFHPIPTRPLWIVYAGKPKNKQLDQWKQLGVGVADSGIISACFVGLLTGLCVVLFNNLVHEIRDVCWDGIPSRGASWLREEPEKMWARIILIPTCGGIGVSLLNIFQSGLKEEEISWVLKPILKALAAAVTLGTGNSLGPEGPSVDIGVSVADSLSQIRKTKLSLKAAGSAAGISSGFNAAVAGCFFAVESVLWPSPAESSLSLTNTTSTVILSAVIASVVSEIGLGSEPAFTVPDYDFRSVTELPLYLLLGVFCGVVSLSLSWCTSWMMTATDKIQIPKAVLPVIGGFSVGVMALVYPEVLYWGFENVDILLESRPFVKGLPVELLLQLVAIKIIATSFCRACGLVGGYYAPSLFIGAATGMAYGKALGFIDPLFHISVASPQAYALVGMAATLAGVCQVPLTAVLLLFELTQDYRIVLPLLGAVGLSSWITSSQSTKRKPETVDSADGQLSLVPYDFDGYSNTRKLLVLEAMKTKYVTVLIDTMLTDVVALLLAEKQSCAIIVDDHNRLIGLLTLGDIHDFCKLSKQTNKIPKELIVSEVCNLSPFPHSVTPMMNLYSAEVIMNTHGINQVPVILEDVPVGILDRECIYIACRALAAREYLNNNPPTN